MGVDWYTELETRCVSQSELAEAAGVTPQCVNRIVRGERRGWPATRRALVRALEQYPPVFGVEQRAEG